MSARTDIRVVKSLAMSRGGLNGARAVAESKNWSDSAQVVKILMAAVTGISTQVDGTGLVGPQGTDLLAAVRPQQIIGKVPGIRHVPFDIQLINTTIGSSAGFVGQGKSPPLTRATYSKVVTTFERQKFTTIAVVDAELARSSDPDSEITLQRDFGDAIIAGKDTAFVDGAAAVAGIRPASITAGSPAFASGGSTALLIDADLDRLIESVLAVGSTLQFACWIIHPITAAYFARVRNANGDYAFPGVTVLGGTLLGLPVIVSASVPHGGSPSIAQIILLDGSRVWLAQDPAMSFDVSPAASLQMLDNPTADVMTPTPTTQVSMFQTSGLALRATEMLNWQIADVRFAAVLNGVSDN
jgi:capsid protein